MPSINKRTREGRGTLAGTSSVVGWVSRRTIGAMLFLIVIVPALSGCGMTESEPELLDKAKRHEAAGDHRAALIELKKLIQRRPDDRDARLLAATIYIGTEQWVQAEREARRAKVLGAKEEDALVLIGKALIGQGEYEKLIREFEDSASGDAMQSPELALLLGEAHLGLGHFDKAEQVFRGILSIQEASVGAMIGLAQTKFKKGDLPAAAAAITQALAADANDKDAWIVAGLVHNAQREYGEAETAFVRALALEGQRGTGSGSFRARVGLAEAQLGQNKLAEARSTVAELSKTWPNQLATKYLRAWLAYHEQDFNAAQTYLYEILTRVPDYAPAQMLLGAVHYAKGNLEQANEYLTKYLNKAPTNMAARKLLTAVRVKLGEPAGGTSGPLPAAGDSQEGAELVAKIDAITASEGSGTADISPKGSVSEDPNGAAVRAEVPRVSMMVSIAKVMKELQESSAEQERGKIAQIEKYVRQQDLKRALDMALEVENAMPNSAAIKTLVGAVALVAGKTEQARTHFNAALGLDRGYLPAELYLGRLDLAEGKAADAEKRFRSLLRKDGKNVSAMIGMAELADRQGDTKQTTSWLEQGRAADPKALAPRLLLGRQYLVRGNNSAARTMLEEAAAIAEYPLVMLLLGEAQQREGDLEGAAKTYEQLTAGQPNMVVAHVARGRLQIRQGRFNEAVLSFLRAVELNPRFVEGKAMLGAAELLSGDKEAALRIANDLQQDQHGAALGHSLAGDVYLTQQQFRQAEQSYLKALDVRKDADTVIKLAQLYLKEGNDARSVEVLQGWPQQHPSDRRVRTALANIYWRSGNVEAAIAEYRNVLEKDADNVVALNNLGWLYSTTDKDAALKYARRAYELKPYSAGIADTLGWVLLVNGQITEGRDLLEKAAAWSEDPTINYHFAVALAKSGDKAAARKSLEQLLKNGVDFQERAEASRLLNALSVQ